ncbi:PREDICTED: glutamate receptor 3-like [Wasmannia auropunctata]|uniref:glutamate receptor 3-like n=1 Tax=Wasmannia auropunctata TaxID=64793 RepID=UPI0005EF7A2D|nr:PREDICTED: glutamate receptor 3-like [Wasmannia auropunctata]
MNFTVEILDPVEAFGSWSEQQKIWVGAVGQLVSNEADIGISAFTMTANRRNVIDFTIPLVRSRYCLYFKKPIVSNVQWHLYLGQGLPEFPRESPMRLAFFSIYVSSIIILASYSASLISFLALNTPKLPFSTLEGYVKDGTYKLIVMQNSADYDVLSSVKDPVYLKMYQLLEEKKYLPETSLDGFKQICQRENLAFYTTEVFKEAMNMYIQCKIVYIDTGRIDNLGLTLTKGSPFTGFINYHLQRFQLNGVMNKLRKKYLTKNNPKTLVNGIIDLHDIAPILTIMMGGMILALFILIIEKMYCSFKTRSKNNKLIVEKLNHNFAVRNKLRKRINDEKNLKLQEFYNRPIGYWP